MGAPTSAASLQGTLPAHRSMAAPGAADMPARRAASALALFLRVGAAVIGGYAFAWGIVAAATSLCVAAGMGFHDAEFVSSLVGVLAYLSAFLWAIAARRLWPVWLALAGGGALLAGLGSAVQAALS